MSGGWDEHVDENPANEFHWTGGLIVRAAVVFILAGFAEIGGGWLVWQAVREGKQWTWALGGSVVLILYGFIPCLQPTSDFGRVYAVYGGFFIALSYLWGAVVDGLKVDQGDLIGGGIALFGVALAYFWPRSTSSTNDRLGQLELSSDTTRLNLGTGDTAFST